jgi:hypothetical protein
MKAVNGARKEKAFARDFGPLAVFVREMGCCICEAGPEFTQACHVKSRGASGHAWLDNGDGNLMPMCQKHHDYQHAHGWNALVIEGGEGEKGEGQAIAAMHAKTLGLRFLADGGERY